MRIIVISDTHIPYRSNLDIKNFLENRKFDLLIHCWDYESIEVVNICKKIWWKNFLWVYGNCDNFQIRQNLPERIKTNLSNIPILIYHSFHVYPRWDRKQLLKDAVKNNVKILFFGHTHKQEIFYYDTEKQIFIDTNNIKLSSNKIYFVNPGSLVDWNFLEIDL